MRRFFVCLTLAACLTQSVLAAPSTDRGQISVAQVREMLEAAPSKPQARQLLVAYLAGVGETAGLLAKCSKSLNLDIDLVASALEAGAPDASRWSQTPATPIIVADLVARGGCR
ncbi:chlorophyllide reductase subunit BchY [Youhaiella tibetensis]|uniref:Chlorophyllide reductase n=1 Tax=Paradevosia tibetensis TaxID=1447062 RepID=A0A5B9DIW7_9HYPH|nr:chlorophyllide reductase [Youhaiella tibetensis]QEE18678.1 chlorophyllide reductase [Youhaiella tibetensis]GGF40153.1 chlorophyllide reductase subunit BchY [Youhaiella tibetensis]